MDAFQGFRALLPLPAEAIQRHDEAAFVGEKGRIAERGERVLDHGGDYRQILDVAGLQLQVLRFLVIRFSRHQRSLMRSMSAPQAESLDRKSTRLNSSH